MGLPSPKAPRPQGELPAGISTEFARAPSTSGGGAPERPTSVEAQPSIKPAWSSSEPLPGPVKAEGPTTTRLQPADPIAPDLAMEVPATEETGSGSFSATTLPEGIENVIWPQRWSSSAANYFDRGGQYYDAYRHAFDALDPTERFALRQWTHVDGTEHSYVDYVDGQAKEDTNQYTEQNYDLNAYLRGGAFDPQLEQSSDVLHNALAKLPELPEPTHMLRVSDVDAHYAEKFKPGEYVTNGRLFMSGSAKNDYAVKSVEQGYAAEGRTGGMAIYDIEAKTARPMLAGITTLAPHEAELVALPNSVYRVEAAFGYTMDTESSQALPMTAMQLKEVTVTEPTRARNIHTGEPVTIGPEEQQPPPLFSEFYDSDVSSSPASEADVSPETSSMDTGSATGSPSSEPVAEHPATPETEPASGPATSQAAAPQALPSTQHPEGIQKLEWLKQWTSPGDRYINEDREYLVSYQNAFDTLSPQERYAIRDWTQVEGQPEYIDIVDGKPVVDTTEYEGTNDDLNWYLDGDDYDSEMELANSNLRNALKKLPPPPEEVPLLRASDVDKDYGSRLKPGDYVTNGRRFMSVSSNRGYAETAFKEGHAARHESEGLALYEFRSRTAVPTVPNVTTLAPHEAEWLHSPHTLFKVKEVVNFQMDTETAAGQPTTVIHLDEVDLAGPTKVKNIHTGVVTYLTPEDQRPVPSPTR